MRSILALTATLLVALAGCGQSTGSPSDFAIGDLAGAVVDAAVVHDIAAPPPDTSTPFDLVVPPDLAVAGSTCGGFAGKQCPNGKLFCDFPKNCGVADQLGQCTPIPDMCPKVLDPVCGCDMKPYGNDCLRQAAGTSLLNYGACGCAMQCAGDQYCAACRGAGFVCLKKGSACRAIEFSYASDVRIRRR